MATKQNNIASFRSKIEAITQALINVQSGNKQTICIDSEANLKLYNELSSNLWNKYNTDELREQLGGDTVNGMFGRFHLNLQQCILNIFLLNKFWSNTNTLEPNYFTLTPEDIKRGALAYEYFLGNMLSIHTSTSTTTKPTKRQQDLINLFAPNETVIHKEFLERCKTVMSDRATRDFINNPIFLEYFDNSKNLGVQYYRRVK